MFPMTLRGEPFIIVRGARAVIFISLFFFLQLSGACYIRILGHPWALAMFFCMTLSSHDNQWVGQDLDFHPRHI